MGGLTRLKVLHMERVWQENNSRVSLFGKLRDRNDFLLHGRIR